MWHTWKKKTRAAVGTAGMLSILDDEAYANRNPVDNETIYHLLQVASSDGNAAHLVGKFEDQKDGRKETTRRKRKHRTKKNQIIGSLWQAT